MQSLAPLLAGILLGTGLGLTLVGVAAHRHHNERFRKHREALQQAETPEEAHCEIKRFHTDPSIDLAILLMWGEPIGWLLFFAGVTALIAYYPL